MRTVAMILAGVLALAAPAMAQTPPQDAMAMFTGLTGACWRSQMDPTSTDTHCFALMVGGKAATDTHKVRSSTGEIVYEGVTVYRLDRASGLLAYDYFNSQGMQLKGYAARVGNEIRFSSQPAAAQPDIIWRLAADHYEVVPRTPELGHPGRFVRVP